MANNPNILIGLKLKDINETQSKLQNDIDKMSKKLNLNISRVELADIDKSQDKLQRSIDRIGKKLNLNISKVQLNDIDKNQNKLQRDVNKISKALNLDISKVSLSDIGKITNNLQKQINSISKNLTLDVRAGNLNGNFVNATNIIDAEKGFENITHDAEKAKETISSMKGELAKISAITNGDGALQSETVTYKLNEAKQAVEKYGTVTREVNGQLVESYGLISTKITDNKEKSREAYESQEKYLDGLLVKLDKIKELSIKGNRVNENYDNSEALEKAVNLQNEINNLKEKGVLLNNQQRNTLNGSINELNEAIRSESGYAAEINRTTQFLERQISILNDLKEKLNSRNDNADERERIGLEIDKEISSYRRLIEENEILGNVEKNRINSSTNELRREVGELSTYESKIKEILTEATAFAIGGSGIDAVFEAIRSGIENVIEMDSAMRDLKKVTDETNESYSKFQQYATETAESVGAATTDYINSATKWAEAGESFKNSELLAKNSIIYQNIGDMTNDEATKGLIATMKAFDLKAKDTMTIMDKVNNVSNHFPIDAKGINDALTRGGSALSTANNNLSETIALITAANSAIQDPSRVGNGLKTISMNLRQMKMSADGLQPKLQKTFDTVTDGQVKLSQTGKNGQKELRSTYDIVLDLSKKWKNLNDEQKANISESVAGKQQANVFASLMENSKDLEKMKEMADKSAGSAMQENERFVNSLQAKINSLKDSWQATTGLFVNTDFLKGVLDGAAKGLNVVKNLLHNFGALPTIIGTATAALTIFSDSFRTKMEGILPYFDSLRNKIDQSANYFKEKAFNISGGTFIDENMVEELKGEIEQVRQAFQDGEISAKEFAETTATLNEKINTDAIKEQKGAIDELKESYKNGETSILSYRTSLIGLQGKLLATKIAMVGVKVAGMALEATLSAGIALIASFAIEKLVEGFSKLQKSIHMTDSQLKEFNSNYIQDSKALSDQINESKKNLNDISDLKKELANTQDEEKRAEIQQKLVDLEKQMAETFPQAASGIDEEGKAIATNNELIKGQIKLKEEEQKVKNLEFAKNNKNSLDDLENFGNKIKEMQQMEKDLENGVRANKTDTFMGIPIATHRESINDLKDLQEEMQKTEQVAKGFSNIVKQYRSEGWSDKEINTKLGGDVTGAIDSYNRAMKDFANSSESARQGSQRVAEGLNQVNNQAKSASVSMKDLKNSFDGFASESKIIKDAMSEFKQTGGLSESTISSILGTKDNDLIASLGNVNTMMDTMKKKLGEVNKARDNAYHQAVNQAMESEGKMTNASEQGSNNRKNVAKNEADEKANSYNKDTNNFSENENEKSKVASDGSNNRTGMVQNEVNNNANAYNADASNHANTENVKSNNASNTGSFISNIYGSLMNFLGVSYGNDANNHASAEGVKGNNASNTGNFISSIYSSLMNFLGVSYGNDVNNHASAENVKSNNASNTGNFISSIYSSVMNFLGISYGTDVNNHANAEGTKGKNASGTSNSILNLYLGIINRLGGAYGNDVSNHRSAENSKGRNTSGLINSVSSMYNKMVSGLGDKYGTDVTNYNNSLNSKLAATSEYAQKTNEMLKSLNSVFVVIGEKEKWAKSKEKLANITKGIDDPTAGPRADTSVPEVDSSYSPVGSSYSPVSPNGGGGASYTPISNSYSPKTSSGGERGSSYTPKRSSYKPSKTSYKSGGSSYKPKGSTYKSRGSSYKPAKNSYKSAKGSSSKSSSIKDSTNISDIDTKIDKYKTLQNAIDEVNNKLDQNKSLEESANSRDKVKYMEQDISLYRQKKNAIDNMIKAKQNEARQLEKELRSKGLNAKDGDISNYTRALENAKARVNRMADNNKHKEKAKKDFEELKDAADRYFELTSSELPKLKKNWTDVNNSMKETSKSMLSLMTDTEKTVVSMIQNEIDKFKSSLEDSTNKLKDELDKQKDLLDNSFDEDDYQRNLKEKQDALNKINAEIASVQRDDSSDGQSRLQDLLDKQKDAEKELNSFIRDRQKSVIDKEFDNESKKMSDDLDNKKKELEKKYTADKIAELAKGMIEKGSINIEGNVISLQKAMQDYYKSQGELFANSSIQIQEFNDNLKVARDLYKELSSMYNSLGIDKSNIITNNGVTVLSAPAMKSNLMRVKQDKAPNVNIKSDLHIGKIENGNISEVKKLLEANNQKIMRQIVDELYN